MSRGTIPPIPLPLGFLPLEPGDVSIDCPSCEACGVIFTDDGNAVSFIERLDGEIVFAPPPRRTRKLSYIPSHQLCRVESAIYSMVIRKQNCRFRELRAAKAAARHRQKGIA